MHYNDSSSQYSMQDLTDIILHPGGSSSVDWSLFTLCLIRKQSNRAHLCRQRSEI